MLHERHVAAFKNPGVRDFLEAEIREDRGLAEALLTGAAYFEQVTNLLQILRGPAGSEDVRPLLNGLETALDRLVDGSSCVLVRTEYSNGRQALVRSAPNVDQRLEQVAGLVSPVAGGKALLRWLERRLSRRADRWSNREGSPTSVVSLLGLIEARADVELPAGWQEAARSVVLNDPWGPDDWQAVIDLRALAPEAFLEEEWTAIGDDFMASAEAYLCDNSDQLVAMEEVERMSSLSEEMGVSLQQNWLDAAESAIHEKLAEADAKEDAELERWREDRGPILGDRSDEMDQLFDGLRES